MLKRVWESIAQKEKRSQIWIVYISVTYISCFLGGPCPDTALTEILIYAMFMDLGVTVGARAVKK